MVVNDVATVTQPYNIIVTPVRVSFKFVQPPSFSDVLHVENVVGGKPRFVHFGLSLSNL